MRDVKRHTHPMIFGRRVAECPRCAELAAGAPAVRWNRRDDEARHLAEVRAHDCRAARCGAVCTFGEW